MLRISDGQRLLHSTGNKHLTSTLLRERGIPVPDFAVYRVVRKPCSRNNV